ncbi:MAG: glutamate-5-semialdehyde dehydrogenase [Planctomycetota bacterium]|jgi:glutamate-5-semialdehyde dehydrogenase|nr:glutamate-5-semialdehyde dehydrogenase [Planctomycetota bacterium]
MAKKKTTKRLTSKSYVEEVVAKARGASREIANLDAVKKDAALRLMAERLSKSSDYLQEENEKDLAAGQKAKLTSALLDRLTLTQSRIDGMAEGLEQIAALQDPVGKILDGWSRPNGLRIQQVRVPIGVIGIIYESRPNVTADAAGLCLKSGNASILRGGKEAIHSNLAIHNVLESCLSDLGVDPAGIQLINRTDRSVVKHLVEREGNLDVIIPRGGEGLIRAISEMSKVPVLKHYKGVCHVYVDEDADLEMARSITFNSKTQRPGVCNAAECLLVHEDIAAGFLPSAIEQLKEAGVEIRACPRTRKIVKGLKVAKPADWGEEFLDLILAVKVVDSQDEAIDFINTNGSGHTDAIVTNNLATSIDFTKRVDSAAVFVNASTRFTDGFEFGFGAEIGISTDRLHARGPVGLEGLTTYKFIVGGNGQLKQ